jgi:hypothetical protein
MRTYQQDHNKAKYALAFEKARFAFASELMCNAVWVADNLARLGPEACKQAALAIANNSGNIGTEARAIMAAALESLAKADAEEYINSSELIGE